MTVKDIANIIKSNETLHYGIRGLKKDENYKIGDTARKSLDWDYENDCESENELDGTCAIDLVFDEYDYDDLEDVIKEAIVNIKAYTENGVALLACDIFTHGCDTNEIIMENAIVKYVF